MITRVEVVIVVTSQVRDYLKHLTFKKIKKLGIPLWFRKKHFFVQKMKH